MNEAIYGILVYAARYWFIVLAVIIVYRACVISVREYRLLARIRGEIGDAGAEAKLVLIADPSGRYEEGAEYPILKECTLGRSRSNDVCIRQRSVMRHHARIDNVADGLRVRPEKTAIVAIEGVRIGREGVVRDGERLRIGNMDFRVRIAREEQ